MSQICIFNDEEQNFRTLGKRVIPQSFSFFPRRELTCFAVVWMTWTISDNFAFYFDLLAAQTNLIPW